jgi:putative flippase GtrA
MLKKLKTHARQLAFFSVAGAAGFLVDGAILLTLIKVLHLHPIAGRVFSFMAAVSVTWYLNRTLTFTRPTGRSLLNEGLRYLSSNGVGALLNFSIYSLLVLFSGNILSQPIFALVIASGVAMFFNFFASKYFAFKEN